MQVRASKIRYRGTRKEQQDVVKLLQVRSSERTESYLVAVLTDGIGGLARGREASEIVNAGVVDALSKSLSGIALSDSQAIHDAVEKAAEAANVELHAFQVQNRLEPCGATLIIGVLAGRCLHFLSIGDSLLLSYAGGSALQKLNASHSHQTEDRTYLASAVLGSEIASVDQASLDLEANSIKAILISSDGLVGQDHGRIAQILGGPDDGKLNDIVALVHAQSEPRQDNLSMILLELA